MRQRSFIAVAVVLAVLVLGAVGVYAYDKTQDDVIANGVSAAGVDIGGMHTAKARATLERELAAPLDRPVVAYYGHRRFILPARRAGVRVNVDAMVHQALTASRRGDMVTRAARALTGGSVHTRIPIAVTYSKPVVARLARRVAGRLYRAPQDANIDYSGGDLSKTPSRNGRRVDARALESDVGSELVQPAADHRVKVPVTVTKPAVTTAALIRRYPRVVTINRGAFRLTLYKDLRPVKSYQIAVGRQGLETPAGRYSIQDKQVNPSWHVPNSSWAGALAGRVIPPGPQDPIKARWMGVNGGAGIHGTDDVGSLGSAASHGCIRMSIPDVEELFNRVQVGDPVFIV